MSGAGEFSGTITAGSYRLVRALGGGGRVHEARHERVAARFALKLLGDVDARAFQSGAHQATKLRHPGIVKVVDYGMNGRGAFVVMEWADGRSLASMLAAAGPLAPDAVARIVDSVALGLQAAHRQGLAHGHLSPDRVLVSGPGIASRSNNDETPGAEHTKILGFGFGPVGALTPGMSITEVTPYTAPEQLAGDASPLADQYALAAVAYELLSGEAPVSDAVLRRPPRSLREYDPTINVVIDDVVHRALSFDPGARWPDVHTFATRLREAVDSEGALEEKTRLAPLPLTVRASVTPTPIELPPVIASVDVDLGTPAPKRRELPFDELAFHELPRPRLPVQGEISMNQPPARQQRLSSPGQRFPTRSPAQPHYGIRPTPTFSFTDDPEPGPLYKPRGRRRRSGGGFGLFVVVIAAGVGGYLSVQTKVWQQAEPLVARAKELARSLRTLAPGASPEAAPVAPAGANANARCSPRRPPARRSPAAAAPTRVRDTRGARAAPRGRADRADAPTSRPSTKTSSAASHHAAHARHPHARAEHAEGATKGRTARTLSDEAAAEEALLAPPSGR